MIAMIIFVTGPLSAQNESLLFGDDAHQWKKHQDVVIAKVIHCVGQCQLDRGDGVHTVQFQSGIFEGDEVFTTEKSSLWIVMKNGALLRLSPKSSVTFTEYLDFANGSANFLRLNHGHIRYIDRNAEPSAVDNSPETDTVFFPLPVYLANPPSPQSTITNANVLTQLDKDESRFEIWRQSFNEKFFTQKNSAPPQSVAPSISTIHYTHLSFPQGSLEGEHLNVEYYGELLQPAYLFHHGGVKAHSAPFAIFRGMNEFKTSEVEAGVWKKILANGEGFEDSFQVDFDHWYLMSGQFVTKKITSIEWCREVMLQDWSEREKNPKNLLNHLNLFNLHKEKFYEMRDSLLADGVSNEKKLESIQKIPGEHGGRVHFLREYLRRLETSNLKVAEYYQQTKLRMAKNLGTEKNWGEYTRDSLSHYHSYYHVGIKEFPDPQEFDYNSRTKTLWKKKYGLR